MLSDDTQPATVEACFLFDHIRIYPMYLDYGGVHFIRFPVRCPCGGCTLQAPPLPSAQAVPEENVGDKGNSKGKRNPSPTPRPLMP